jgi:hypothetical protein
VSPVRYKRGFYIAEDNILRSHSRERLKSYIFKNCLFDSAACVRAWSTLRNDYQFENCGYSEQSFNLLRQLRHVSH